MTQKSNERSPFGQPPYKEHGHTMFILFNGIPLAVSGVARHVLLDDKGGLGLHTTNPPQKGDHILISMDLIRFWTEQRAEFELYLGRTIHGLDQITLEVLIQAFTRPIDESPLAFLMLHITSRMHEDVDTKHPGAQAMSTIDMYGGLGTMMLGIPGTSPGGSTSIFMPQPHHMNPKPPVPPGEKPTTSDLKEMMDKEDEGGGDPPLPFSTN